MKLTLRELFPLVALVAMGCGWWVERLHLLHALAGKNDEINRLVEGINRYSSTYGGKLVGADIYPVDW
jgi:hypothetical protein